MWSYPRWIEDTFKIWPLWPDLDHMWPCYSEAECSTWCRMKSEGVIKWEQFRPERDVNVGVRSRVNWSSHYRDVWVWTNAATNTAHTNMCESVSHIPAALSSYTSWTVSDHSVAGRTGIFLTWGRSGVTDIVSSDIKADAEAAPGSSSCQS